MKVDLCALIFVLGICCSKVIGPLDTESKVQSTKFKEQS
jgi:hypothetical protein